MSRTVDKYTKVRKAPETAPENEVKIKAVSQIGKYISYAASLLLEKKLDTVLIKASGNAARSACQIAEILRHKIAGLHQLNNLKTISVVDEYEPREEGLDRVVVERKLAVLEIALTLRDNLFDTKAPGYQEPLPKDQVQEEDLKDILSGRRGGDRGGFRGGRRGGRGGRDGEGEGEEGGYRGGRYNDREEGGYRGGRYEEGGRGGRGGRGYRGDRGGRGFRGGRGGRYNDREEGGYRGGRYNDREEGGQGGRGGRYNDREEGGRYNDREEGGRYNDREEGGRGRGGFRRGRYAGARGSRGGPRGGRGEDRE